MKLGVNLSSAITSALCLCASLFANSEDVLLRPPANLSVDYRDAPVREILTDVAHRSGFRVVLPNHPLKSSSTIKGHNEAWPVVFDEVLSPLGFEYIVHADHVEVLATSDADALPAVRVRSEVYFQRPEALCVFVRKVFPPKGKFPVTIDPDENAVSFLVHPRHANLVRIVLSQVDNPDFRMDRFPRTPHFPDQIDPLPAPKDPDWINQVTEIPAMVTTDFVFLDWVDCGEVLKVVQREYPDIWRISADYLRNQLVVTDKPLMHRKVAALAAYLDDKRWYDAPEQK